MRAIATRHLSVSPEEVDRRVALRMTRQQVLSRPSPPRLWAVIDEAALRRPVGGRDVMRGQLERLIEASKLPNVTLQVLPFSVGSHSAEAGAFTILRFPDSDMPDIAYLEQLTSAIYLDKPTRSSSTWRPWSACVSRARSPRTRSSCSSRILQET